MPKRPRPAALALAAGALLVAAIAAALVASLSGTGVAGSSPPHAQPSAGAESGFAGAALPSGIVAPSFTLRDQSGRVVSLSDERGQVVLLTFLYTTCGATCTLIAQQIRGALDELAGEHARPPVVLIVSADPAADTRARVSRFLAEASLSGRAQYLTGPPARLRAVWRAYHVTPASAGRAAFENFASVLLLDARGSERVLFQSEQLTPEALSHDIGKLD